MPPTPTPHGESSSSTGNDAPWHPKPRLNDEVVTLLRESIGQMVAHQTSTNPKTSRAHALSRAPAAAPESAPAAHRPRHAPQCTHITMSRLYGNYACHLCNKVSDLGYVYQCDEDHLQAIRGASQSIEALPLVPDHGNFFEAQAEIAKSLGMSRSIVTQMRAGEYSYEQIETLLVQRRNVTEHVKEAQRSASKTPPKSNKTLMSKLIASSSPSPSSSTNHNASANLATGPFLRLVADDAAPISAAQSSIDAPNDRPSNKKGKMVAKPKCNFQVCHFCRPLFQERVPTSFEAVLSDEVPSMTRGEMAQLPVRNSSIVRNLGLYHTEQRNEPDRWINEESDDISDDSTPSSSSGDSPRDSGSPDPYPCPGIFICPVFSQSDGCAYEKGFDDDKRAINHGFGTDNAQDPTSAPSTTPNSPHTTGALANSLGASPSNTSSISLPDLLTEPLTPSKPQFRSQLDFGALKTKVSLRPSASGRSASQQGYAFQPFNFHRSNSTDIMGDEIDVDGGVALTEQAVEIGVPDIINERV